MQLTTPIRETLQSLVLASATLFASACMRSGTTVRLTPRLGDARTLVTTADVRIVTATPIVETEWDERGNAKVTRRRQITCAEPSPDIAKAVSDAFSGSSALAVRGKSAQTPVEGALDTTNAASRSYAESVAQMTERLGTIQLLRDGLYRACEAYANGAISDRTYAVMLSRYDDTMITMLLGEMVAGNFGRSLATLTGSASGKAAAEQPGLDEAKAQLAAAKSEATDKQKAAKKAEDRLDESVRNGDETEKTKTLKKDADDKQADADASEANVHEKEEKVAALQKASAETSVKTTAAAAGEIAREQRQSVDAVAKTLGAMQRNYLNDHNVDGLKVICLTDQDPTIRRWCDHFMGFLENEHEAQRVRRAATDPSLLQQIFVGVPHKEESKPAKTGK